MSLRDDLIETMAEALGPEGEWWGPNGASLYAKEALDAALAYLHANMPEWVMAAETYDVSDLIAALYPCSSRCIPERGLHCEHD